MAKATGRVSMTEAYAQELLKDHPDWIIANGMIGHPDDIAQEIGEGE